MERFFKQLKFSNYLASHILVNIIFKEKAKFYDGELFVEI